MYKIITCLILFLFLSTIQEQLPKKYDIGEPTFEEDNPERILEKDYIFWTELKDKQKLKLILDIVEMGDGNLKFQIAYSNNDKDSIVKDIAFQMTSIQYCIDVEGWEMYYAFKSDLQIGTVMIECMRRKNMFRD